MQDRLSTTAGPGRRPTPVCMAHRALALETQEAQLDELHREARAALDHQQQLLKRHAEASAAVTAAEEAQREAESRDSENGGAGAAEGG